MTTYQLVPYLLSVHLKNRPSETTPLDDLFASGLTFVDEVSGALAVHAGRLIEEPISADTKARPKRLRVEGLGKDQRLLTATISPGRSGVQSQIARIGGGEIARDFGDTELMPLRHMLLHAPGSHRAVLLAERVGGVGAISSLSSLLKSAWSRKHQQWKLEIAPAMSEQAFATAMAERPIKGFRLRRTKAGNADFRLGTIDTDVYLNVRPRKGIRRSWRLAEFGENPKAAILQELRPILAPGANPDHAAAAMLEEQWLVGVTLKLPGGTERTVFVEQKDAVSLSIPIIDGELEPRQRPGSEQVAEACARVVSDGMLEEWGIHRELADHCRWLPPTWEDGSKWKVVWSDAHQSGPDRLGPVPSRAE